MENMENMDYLLCPPSEDFHGTCGKRALYSDARVFSHALLGSLRKGDDQPLLLPQARDFWTEHSDRAGVDSLLPALGVSEDLRRFLGRWSAKGAADVYVRAAVRISENLQRLAAAHAKKSWHGGPDFFGEEHLLKQLAAHLRAREVSEDEVYSQTYALQVADYTLPHQPLGRALDSGAVELPEENASAGDGVPLDLPLPEANLAEDNDEDANNADLAELAAEPGDGDSALPNGFIVSVAQGARMRRLHFAGGCHLVSCEHYKVYEDFGQTCPEAHQVTARCRMCFPAEAAAARAAEQAEEDSLSESSMLSSLPEEDGVLGAEPDSS